jgi:hypothetical protein
MKYILYGTKNTYRLTTVKNYNAYIQDARKITYFDDFSSVQQVLEYIALYCKIAIADVCIAVH